MKIETFNITLLLVVLMQIKYDMLVSSSVEDTPCTTRCWCQNNHILVFRFIIICHHFCRLFQASVVILGLANILTPEVSARLYLAPPGLKLFEVLEFLLLVWLPACVTLLLHFADLAIVVTTPSDLCCLCSSQGIAYCCDCSLPYSPFSYSIRVSANRAHLLLPFCFFRFALSARSLEHFDKAAYVEGCLVFSAWARHFILC